MLVISFLCFFSSQLPFELVHCDINTLEGVVTVLINNKNIPVSAGGDDFDFNILTIAASSSIDNHLHAFYAVVESWHFRGLFPGVGPDGF